MPTLNETDGSWWYSVQFRNLLLDPDDPDEQDYEWGAWIIIEASSREQAIEWGDHLSKRYLNDNENEQYIKSDAKPYVKDARIDDSDSPRIKYGYEASDDEIGW